jgi:predicted lipoprotein with Yx(FWY)xxD motif
MKSKLLMSTLLGLVLVLSACAPQQTTPTAMVPQTGSTPSGAMTEAPSTTMSESPTEQATDSSTEAMTEAPNTSTGMTIKTSESATMGTYLVDDQGMSVYLFMNDTQNSGKSVCAGNCATNWPPVLVNSAPTAGTGVDASLLGTITRDDGSLQATYNGWPLYYFAKDSAPGDTMGQGAVNSWYLVSAAGDPVK